MRLPGIPTDFVIPPATKALPELPFWQARSFWLTVLALLAMILPALGLDWPWVNDPATVDRIMQLVGALSAALAWRERLAPNFRLGMTQALMLIAATGMALTLCLPSRAMAAPPCALRADQAAHLTEAFGESVRLTGLDQMGVVLEVWASPSGDWTVTITRPDGVTCRMAAGTDLEILADPLAAHGVPG